MANKMFIAIIAVLVIVIVAMLYYFLVIAQQSTSAVKVSQQDVGSKEAAQKASSDVASAVGNLQKDLLDIKTNLP